MSDKIYVISNTLRKARQVAILKGGDPKNVGWINTVQKARGMRGVKAFFAFDKSCRPDEKFDELVRALPALGIDVESI